MSIPPIKLTSQSKSRIFNPPKINKSFRDASFASYLDGTEETFVLKRLNPSISTFSTPYDHIFHGRNQTVDREIDVFNAEKYFNEGLNHIPKVANKNLSGHHLKKDETLEIFAIKEQPQVATPSIRSESSSNSRSMLLKKHQPRKTNKKSFLASLGFNCSCNDKNSLEVDDCTDGGKSKEADKTRNDFVTKPESDYNCVKFDEPELRIKSSGRFSFPVFNSRPGNRNQAVPRPGNVNQAVPRPGNGNQTVSKPGNVNQAVQPQNEERKSVFGSPIRENTKKNSLSLDKNLTMFTWDEIKIPSISSECHNDTDSDASSDLFEIESFSTGNHFLSRQASDCLSGCYAPSEASIEWSIVTASAADNFSAPSDSEELKTTISHSQKVGLNSKNGSSMEIPKRRSSILSGCNSQKAVRVAGDAHRSNYKGFSNGRSEFRAD
ncbi:hypothetical protein BUALT_Bualt17G0069700 [Buddleja alternifolia]|uniref:Protein PHYTOCHROME KINASE SUBSTRATE 1-like n=1 Tax=Buddleja alternifolia TaxID=168488 RepID=A0AAV6WH93_9LAMI|nr:hypothetical protein BUALT_Bualt17G0069700 [Buddleja alternifolia]